MANICDTCLCFHSTDKRAVEDLNLLINNAMTLIREKDTNLFDLAEIAMHFELDTKDFPDLRGNVNEVSCVEDVEDSNGIIHWKFYIMQEDKWAPRTKIWKALLEKFHFDLIEMEVEAEEPGFQVFINTDTTQLYFDMRYCIDICYDPEDIPESLEILHSNHDSFMNGIYEFFSDEQSLLDYVQHNITARYNNIDDLMQDKDLNVIKYASSYTENY